MGIPLSTTLSLNTDIPFFIIRKISYGLEDECQVHKETRYRKIELFINNIKENNSLLLIDDIVSNGGTLIIIITSIYKIKTNLEHIILPIKKDDGKKIVEGATNKKLVH